MQRVEAALQPISLQLAGGKTDAGLLYPQSQQSAKFWKTHVGILAQGSCCKKHIQVDCWASLSCQVSENLPKSPPVRADKISPRTNRLSLQLAGQGCY